MWLVALRHLKWAIFEWILESHRVTLDVGVRGPTLSSALDPNESVIRSDRIDPNREHDQPVVTAGSSSRSPLSGNRRRTVDSRLELPNVDFS